MHRSTQATRIRVAETALTKVMVIATITTTTQGVIGMAVTAVHQPVDVDMSQRNTARRSGLNNGVVFVVAAVVSSVRVCVLLRG